MKRASVVIKNVKLQRRKSQKVLPANEKWDEAKLVTAPFERMKRTSVKSLRRKKSDENFESDILRRNVSPTKYTALACLDSVTCLTLSGITVGISLLLLAGFVFVATEHDLYQQQLDLKNDRLQNMKSIFAASLNSHEINTVNEYCWLNKTTLHYNPWDFTGSAYFAISLSSTVGYGFYTPQTTGGRLFSMIFGFITIPLFMVVSFYYASVWTGVVDGFLQRLELLSHTRKFIIPFAERSVSMQILSLILLILFNVTIMGLFYSCTENWSAMEIIFFIFNTSTTIGLGDLQPRFGGGNMWTFMFASHCYFCVVGSFILVFECASNFLDRSHRLAITKARQTLALNWLEEHSIDVMRQSVSTLLTNFSANEVLKFLHNEEKSKSEHAEKSKSEHLEAQNWHRRISTSLVKNVRASNIFKTTHELELDEYSGLLGEKIKDIQRLSIAAFTPSQGQLYSETLMDLDQIEEDKESSTAHWNGKAEIITVTPPAI